MPAARGVAAEEREAGLGRATADGLGRTGNDDRAADNLGNGCATAGEMVDEYSACMGVPAANLTVAATGPGVRALVLIGETRAGTLPNLGGDEISLSVPDAKCSACTAGNLGRADTTFVLLGTKAVPRPDVPVSWTGLTLGVVASNAEPTAVVHATKGDVATCKAGSLAGDWDKTGARGATVALLALWGGTDAPVLTALAVGTCCGAGLEITRTWVPGPKPWGGTTKRALFKRICVPAARGVVVLMTILCWTVPVREFVNGALVVVAEEMGIWPFLISC